MEKKKWESHMDLISTRFNQIKLLKGETKFENLFWGAALKEVLMPTTHPSSTHHILPLS
jgi:hypothetical protein